jgi:predicted nucleic acid-binding protein
MWAASREGRTRPEAGQAAIESARIAFTELTPDLDLIGEASALLRSLRHPMYDCLYLALALRSAATLITADDKQFAAARKARIAAKLL